jgi:phosphatidylserine/phosphatidylglycerophosphate/cardiolipin synthase-like enzyme
MDARSLWINHELLVVVRSRALAARLEEMIEFEIARSRRLSPKAERERSCWRRWRDRLAWSLRWWL